MVWYGIVYSMVWYDTMYLPEHGGNIEDKVGAKGKAFAVANPDEGRDTYKTGLLSRF